jgi:hypothetical protein
MIRSKKNENFDEVFIALKDIYGDIVSGNNGVHSKKSLGSTHPDLVKKAILQEEKWLKTAYSDLK